MNFIIRRIHLFALGVLMSVMSVNALAVGYYAQAGKIYDENNREVQLRGISHYGFNAATLQPQYLWAQGWKEQIAHTKSLGFNAVRVPFVPDTLYVTTPLNELSYLHPTLNADLIGKTSLQALDMWMAEANRQGLYILMDFHSVTKQRLYPTWFLTNPADFNLVYNNQAYTADHWRRDLQFVARRYAHLPYFMGMDVYNEPNSIVRWSTGSNGAPSPEYYWKEAAESAATAVLTANPNLLIFVQGINGNFDGRERSIPMGWGEDLQPHAYQPLNIPFSKLVLSPHTYGPDVYVKSSFSAPNFPANLAADWESMFGQFSAVNPVVVGEWGGRYGTAHAQDVAWQNAFVDYLISKGIRSSFYWCYSPNSGDTGGILDDNLNVREDKMTLLRRHWGTTGTGTPAPSPTPTPSPAPTPAPTPAPAPAPAPTPAPAPSTGAQLQQSISTFSPISGPVGTVVTINGNGFTGSNRAWVGKALNGTIRVISDTQVQVTVPAGATTGAIGVLNPVHAAFTAQSFTVSSAGTAPTPAPNPAPAPAPAPAVQLQQYISNFSPTSGPVGTVVTINGNGFTGSNRAWVGKALNGTIRVVSDRQVQVTVPAGATTGAIGVLNPAHAAFTAQSFTVSSGTAPTPTPAPTPAPTPTPVPAPAPTPSTGVQLQQHISNFTPTSGPVGTVVTINGNGFTGSNRAWLGLALNAPIRVISDTQVQVTVPAGATTGAIGVLNPAHAAFTAQSFTVR